MTFTDMHDTWYLCLFQIPITQMKCEGNILSRDFTLLSMDILTNVMGNSVNK